jgi:penicillin-binding protein 1A
MVRQEALDRLGNEALSDGYSVVTTLDSRMQQAADDAVRDDLIAYDRRHGYRGPEAHVEITPESAKDDWDKHLANFRNVSGLVPGLVTEVDKEHATVYLEDAQSVPLDLKAVQWARPYKSESAVGAAPKSVDAVLKVGDIVRLERNAEGNWELSQIPAAQSALVSLDPENGAIRAMVGGFSFARSKFNRATQSARQPGSGFKPFLYSASFEHGFTPASILNDAPLVFPDPSKPDGIWSPSNDDDKFEGPMRLREALVKSVNLVSVRLLDAIGVRYAREYATRFGLPLEALPENLSMALGTASVSPLLMARGYAVFANGGFLVEPYFLESVADRDGKTVFQAAPATACTHCPQRLLEEARSAQAAGQQGAAPGTPPPPPPHATPLSPIGNAEASTAAPAADGSQPKLAPRAIDARNAYLVTSMMRDVVRRGTGHDAMVLKRNDLAGKTGTTNDHRDAWFTGFNDRVVTSVWVGFDDFSSLGRGEFGAKAALPIWIDYMRAALDGMAEHPFAMPPGVSTARIDPATGTLASSEDPDAMLEVFKTEDIARLSAHRDENDENSESKQREAYDIF